MPKFKIGDRVTRTGPLVPNYMQDGTILTVIPDVQGVDWANRYEIDFKYMRVTVYESELKPLRNDPLHWD